MLTAAVDEYLETEYPKFEETFEDLYSLSISSQEEDSILNLENELNLLSRKSLENTVDNELMQEPEHVLENVPVQNTPVQDSLEILQFKKEILLEKQKELEILQKEFQIQNQNSKIEILELKKEISLKSQENLDLKRENTTVLKEIQELKQENSEILSNSKNLEIKNISLQELIKNLKLGMEQEKENSKEILENLEKLKLDKKREEEHSRDVLEKEKVIWEQEKVKEIKEIKEKLSKSCTDAYSSSISRVQSHLEQEKKSLLEDFERDKQMIKDSFLRERDMLTRELSEAKRKHSGEIKELKQKYLVILKQMKEDLVSSKANTLSRLEKEWKKRRLHYEEKLSAIRRHLSTHPMYCKECMDLFSS